VLENTESSKPLRRFFICEKYDLKNSSIDLKSRGTGSQTCDVEEDRLVKMKEKLVKFIARHIVYRRSVRL